MCSRTRPAAGTRAKVSISGSRARSSARIASAAASSPSTAPSIIASWRPRTGAGISSNGGSCRIRNDVVTASGASTAQRAQVRSTFSASFRSQTSIPAYAVSIG